MEVLLSREFLEIARSHAQELHTRLPQLLQDTSPSPEGLADPIAEHTYLGWCHQEEAVYLWFIHPSDPQLQVVPDPPLLTCSPGQLRALGVSDNVIPQVQRVSSLRQLEETGVTGRSLSRLRFLFIQRALGFSVQRMETQRRAENLAQLLDFLRGDLRELLLHLDPQQQQVVNLGPNGNIVVRGVAGSGKTAVALQRIARLLINRSLLESPSILFLTFNRLLSATAAELLRSLGLKPDEVEVCTFHQWCHRLIPGRNILEPRTRLRRILSALESVKVHEPSESVWNLPIRFWDREIHLIQTRVAEGLSEYLTLPRTGMGRALEGHQRKLVWVVYLAYERKKALDDWIDWDDLVRLAYRELLSLGPSAPRYDHVFVDEAQDLTRMAMRVVSLLGRPPGNLFIGYDPAQSIYERGFRWKDCGITVHGARSFCLRKNFRNTCEILEAARPLLVGLDRDAGDADLGEKESLLDPERAIRTGSPVQVLLTGKLEETMAAANAIRKLIEDERIPPQNIAVLCYPNSVKSKMVEQLRRLDISCQVQDPNSPVNISDPSVKVLPCKSSKGLEFPVVFLIASGRYFAPSSNNLADEEQGPYQHEMRRLLYTSMTRAMERLILVCSKTDLNPHLLHLLA